jgi:outer membrane protein OmpA-like peptidoglycan-associated protein
MKFLPTNLNKLVAFTSATILLSSCVSAPTVSDGAVAARADLIRLQADRNLASLARVEIADADKAVTSAERPVNNPELSQHLVLMAQAKIETARSWAQSRYYLEQREVLGAESDAARLAARTMEADRARSETSTAQASAVTARREAELAETRSQSARDEADLARTATNEARAETAELQQQVSELNARATDRGLVMTLGDIMFETGKYDLRSGTTANLDKLAVFLERYEDRTVKIEGHTDSTGSAESNLVLSRNRAESVSEYLVAQGIASNRLTNTGRGEDMPVADNGTSYGRQQNRRVELIISNEVQQ